MNKQKQISVFVWHWQTNYDLKLKFLAHQSLWPKDEYFHLCLSIHQSIHLSVFSFKHKIVTDLLDLNQITINHAYSTAMKIYKT